MKYDHAQYLRSPEDKEALQLHVTRKRNDEIVSGTLVTPRGTVYPIINGIPRFISIVNDPGQLRTAAVFSRKWRTVPEFGKERHTRQTYKTWYLQRYGFRTEKALSRFLDQKEFILDAGTGVGRDALWFVQLSRGTVFGLDLANTIEIARRNAPKRTTVCFIQGDLSHLPFKKGFFDFISCDQVIHHTKDSKHSFAHLAGHLAPGGHICLYVYKKKAPIREYSDDFLRKHLTVCSEKECWEFSRAVTDIGRQLADLKATITIPRGIPLLGIPKGTFDVQRFLYWHFIKCFWNQEFSPAINVAHNYDWYRPFYAHRHTPHEVQGWFKELGLRIEHFDVCDSGISVLGYKPKRKKER
jgi:SAM-dependent methyltransferase/uncharacterized protein YbaR (Trm112 family)